MRTRAGGSASPKTILIKEREALTMRAIAVIRVASSSEKPIHLALCLIAGSILLLSSCVAPDREHHIVISTRDQKLALLEKGKLVAVYPVSTSKFGLGDGRGTWRTPLG